MPDQGILIFVQCGRCRPSSLRSSRRPKPTQPKLAPRRTLKMPRLWSGAGNGEWPGDKRSRPTGYHTNFTVALRTFLSTLSVDPFSAPCSILLWIFGPGQLAGGQAISGRCQGGAFNQWDELDSYQRCWKCENRCFASCGVPRIKSNGFVNDTTHS